MGGGEVRRWVFLNRLVVGKIEMHVTKTLQVRYSGSK